MKCRYFRAWLLTMILLYSAMLDAGARLTKETLDAWTNYIDLTEKRIDKELQNTSVLQRSDVAFLKTGKIQIQRMTTRIWRAKLSRFLRERCRTGGEQS